MNKDLSTRHILTLFLVAAPAAALLLSGCEEYCTSTEQSYEQALAAEHTELAEPEDLSGDSPSQFGLSMKTSLIGDILDIVLQPTLEAALGAVSNIQVGGQSIGLSSRGQLLSLDVASSSACEHCFGVGGSLGGQIIADVPGLGQKTANLGGSMNIVAPLTLGKGEDSDGALKLDLPAFAGIGQSTLSAQLGGISSDLANTLEGPLSDLFFNAIAQRLSPVTLFEFNAPSFGIPGFEVLPVELVTEGDTDTVFAGFATNIEALNAPGSPSVAPITDLGADENFAFAFQPAIISHSLSLLMGDNQVSRTYDLSGNAASDGNSHVTLGKFLVGDDVLGGPGSTPDAGYSEDVNYSADITSESALTARSALEDSSPDVPFSLGFDVFNLASNSNFCFGFGAEAVGGVSVRQNALEVDLIDIRFTNDTLQENLVQLSNWAGADFITESQNLVSQSLSRTSVAVPGTSIEFSGLGLGVRPNAVVLRANSTPTEAEAEAE